MLVFLEDPGAANFAAELPSALERCAVRATLVATGGAVAHLRDRRVELAEVRQDDTAATLLDRFSPTLVVVGTSENPDSLAHSLVEESRARSLATAGLVDAYANAAHRFRGRSADRFAHAPDLVIVPDAWTRDAFIDLGMPAARLRALGHPHYDRVARARVELDEKRAETRARMFRGAGTRPVLVFVSEISTGLAADQFQRSADYTLAGRGGRHGRTEIVLEELLDALDTLPQRPHVVLRLHPKNTRAELAELADEVDQVSDRDSALELVHAADLVVGMTSMLLLEGVLLGRPTLSVVPRRVECDWLPTVRDGTTPCATTRSELRELLPMWREQRPPLDLPGLGTSLDAVSRALVEFAERHGGDHGRE